MTSKTLKNLDLNDIYCDWFPTNIQDACKNICTCWKFPEKQTIFANCSHLNLTDIPSLVGKYNEWAIELNLSGNRIEYLPSLKNETFQNVKVLDVSENNISSISTDVFSKSLQVLKIHNNAITNLSNSVIQYLEKPNITLINLTLYGNPWKCNCDAQKLTEISSIKNIVNAKKTLCKMNHEHEELLFNVNFTSICPGKNISSNNEIHHDPDNLFNKIVVSGILLVCLVFTICCCYCNYDKLKSFICNISCYK